MSWATLGLLGCRAPVQDIHSLPAYGALHSCPYLGNPRWLLGLNLGRSEETDSESNLLGFEAQLYHLLFVSL